MLDIPSTVCYATPMIKSIQELKIGALVVRESDADNTCHSPADIQRIWKTCVENASWYQPDKEAFVVFLLDVKNNVRGYNLVTLGLLDASLVHAREVFRPAIVGAASSIILAHNHPSGNTTPGMEDLSITSQMIEAGKIIGIPVRDHIIIGNAMDYFSMRETGMKIFPDFS